MPERSAQHFACFPHVFCMFATCLPHANPGYNFWPDIAPAPRSAGRPLPCRTPSAGKGQQRSGEGSDPSSSALPQPVPYTLPRTPRASPLYRVGSAAKPLLSTWPQPPQLAGQPTPLPTRSGSSRPACRCALAEVAGFSLRCRPAFVKQHLSFSPFLCAHQLEGLASETERAFKPGENLKCLSHIVKTEGVRGLYRGLMASYLGVVETAIQFVLYEELRQRIASQRGDGPAGKALQPSAPPPAPLSRRLFLCLTDAPSLPSAQRVGRRLCQAELPKWLPAWRGTRMRWYGRECGRKKERTEDTAQLSGPQRCAHPASEPNTGSVGSVGGVAWI